MLSLIQRRNKKGGNYVTLIIPSVCNSPELADYFAIFIDFLSKPQCIPLSILSIFALSFTDWVTDYSG
ncbi:conserved hypothetical protein [Alteromonas sp. 38]|nr:conserved hypothetical protein [Alteromonas sp. 154]VXC43605.1 conserved hypothetical protein [Alteromonas sp. 38]